MLDVVLRGVRLYDGSGAKSVTSAVGVRDGKIVQVGDSDEPARRSIDAGGLALMPGIVDLHTHYDAQITWDPTLSPSVALGVTTAVMGNCGFGIAPCPAAQRETVLRNLSVVEGMDVEALLAGTRWEFESFAQYLAMLERQRPLANVAVLAQHSTIRSAVMGEAASERNTPSDRELGEMRRLVAEALDAGAIGFASSFSPNHSGWGGRPMPSTIATDDELKALAGALGDAGRGVFVMATGSRATPEYMESIAADTGRPAFMVTVLTMHNHADPGRALAYYEQCAGAIARGHEVYIHTSCQPLSFDFTLKDPYLMYSHDAFEPVRRARPEELPAIYADPGFRARFRDNLAHPGKGILFYGDWDKVEAVGAPLTDLAREAGKDPLDYFFDLPIDTPLVAKLFQNDDAGVAPLIRHPAGVVALSDAGAHLIFLCDAGFGLHLLAHWVRDTETLTLEEGVRRLTSDPAQKYRIPGRGRIAPGLAADLLLFDPLGVGVSPLERVADLPGGGTRVIRRPKGVAGVWVNGQQVFDGSEVPRLKAGPGEVLDRFEP